MKVAVDSSVLLSIFKIEQNSERWMDLLIEKASTGSLCICEVVVAEVGAHFDNLRNFRAQLNKLGLQFEPVNFEASFLAGEIFRKYRSEGGKREYLIPDFLVAAHAYHQADALLALDRGYMRRYFPKLKVLA